MFECSKTLTKEEKIVFESLKEYANKFHRVGELKEYIKTDETKGITYSQ